MAKIVSWASTLGVKLGKTPTDLACKVLREAVDRAPTSIHIDGFLACPSLAEPLFMTAHHYASASGILPARNVRIATLDTGGASPISMILHARRLVERGECSAVAVVASDAISSMPSADFLRAADSAVVTPPGSTHPPCETMPSPRIPYGYSRYTDAHMRSAPLTREQLAMVSVLMSHQGAKHPGALSKGTLSLESVLGAPAVAPLIGQFECARRADGAAAVIVARGGGGAAQGGGVRVAGGGEAAGSSHPPRDDADAMLCMEGAGDAFRQAYADAGCESDEIDWYGIYDCYPICFIRGLEAAGVCGKGEGGAYVESKYRRLLQVGSLDMADFPINTHGGLLGMGAPWEAPALFTVIEACEQLMGASGREQLSSKESKRAAVYGNGGVFGASAVAILESRGA